MIQKTQRSPFAKHSASGGFQGPCCKKAYLVIWLEFFVSKNQLENHSKFTENGIRYDRMPDEKMFVRYKHVVEMGTTHKLDHEATSAFQPNLPSASWYPAGWMSLRDLQGPYTQGESSKMIFKIQGSTKDMYISTIIYIYISVYSCIWVSRESLQLDLTFGGWRYWICFY